MTGRLSRDRGRYDPQRVAHLQPLKDAVGLIGLPVLRLRKITAVIAALEVQIEDGGTIPRSTRCSWTRYGPRYGVRERMCRSPPRSTPWTPSPEPTASIRSRRVLVCSRWLRRRRRSGLTS